MDGSRKAPSQGKRTAVDIIVERNFNKEDQGRLHGGVQSLRRKCSGLATGSMKNQAASPACCVLIPDVRTTEARSRLWLVNRCDAAFCFISPQCSCISPLKHGNVPVDP